MIEARDKMYSWKMNILFSSMIPNCVFILQSDKFETKAFGKIELTIYFSITKQKQQYFKILPNLSR